MFKSKSFDLTTEENRVKKREKLYQPKRLRWLKYIVIPALLGFVLMLILCNVDFDGDTNEQQTDMVNYATPKTKMAKSSFPMGPKVLCNLVNNSNCDLFCSGYINDIIMELETLQRACSYDLNLYIENAYFDFGIWKERLFAGNYRLSSLIFKDCNIFTIEEKAFKQTSLQNLIELELNPTMMNKLNKKTFESLNQLKKFKLVNRHSNIFTVDDFLKPLAKTVVHIEILQKPELTSMDVVENPLKWFGNSNYEKLEHLDLHGNNFANGLSAIIFERMPVLRILNLSNCLLKILDANLFTKNWATLRMLNLHNNNLVKLDNNFMQNVNERNIQLIFHGNLWDCTCQIQMLLKYARIEVIENMPQCFSPEELRNRKMNKIKLYCDDDSDFEIDVSEIDEKISAEITTTTIIIDTTTTDEIENQTSDTTTTDEIENQTEIDSNEIVTTNEDTTTTDAIITTTTTKKVKLPTPPLRTTTTTATTTTTTEELTTPETDDNLDNKFIKNLYCINTKNEITENLFIEFNVFITITNESSSSVNIFMYGKFENIHVQLVSLNSDKVYKIQESTVYENQLFFHVDELLCGESYVFCLLADHKPTTSPLNCQSHRLQHCSTIDSWFQKQLSLLIPLSCIGIIIFILLGVLIIYLILRRRPTWLYGSKRILRQRGDSLKVLLLPKQRKHDKILYPNLYDRYIEDNNYDYIAYYQKQQDTSMLKIFKSDQINSPYEIAPEVPKIKIPKNLSYVTRLKQENAYITEETYEELY